MDIQNKPQKNNKLHKMVRDLLSKFCDECGSVYQDDDVKIIQKDNSAIMVHLSCKNCGKTHLASIVKPLGITNRMPIKTDLLPTEINKFAGKKGISADDVLDIYEWAQKTENVDEVLKKLLG